MRLSIDKGWKFNNADGTYKGKASVPGCVHTDLFKNKLIKDPYYRDNEVNLQWIDKINWIYETAFDIPSGLMHEENLNLVFEGLDTYSEVYFNTVLIGKTDNMFVEWSFDIKKLAKNKGNNLKIIFLSPINNGLEKLEKLGYNLPAVNDVSEFGGIGDKKVSVFARKAPYHFGWDWGPRFVTSGIWRAVYLEGFSLVNFNDIYIRQNEVNSNTAMLTAVIDLDINSAGKISIYYEDKKVSGIIDKAGKNQVIEIDFEVKNPRLWWCNGLGKPELYEFNVQVIIGDKVKAEKKIITGLRKIELIREIDKYGKSFYFKLNGVSVFCKGANHIPNDSFIPQITFQRYEHEINTAVMSNMNMLRVWGGGFYENSCFYELCDSMGILLWHDFMFACSLYPGDEAFLNNVTKEAIYNVKRLRNHPSIALWCGNNEMDVAWSNFRENYGWGWKEKFTKEQRNILWRDYCAIFHKILPDTVSRLTNSSYWPSSPMRDISFDEHQHSYWEADSGDIHFWGNIEEPGCSYREKIGRFMSEYGYQAFPDEKTINDFAVSSDFNFESKEMINHQKHPRGIKVMMDDLKNYYKDPDGFINFTYLSQLKQAEAIKIAIEAHRCRKPYCMGTLYWQINDCWPAISWASLDYFGRWKALQYFAMDCYKNLCLAWYPGKDEIILKVISDLREDCRCKIKINLIDFSGKLLKDYIIENLISGNSVTDVFKAETAGFEKLSSLKNILLSAELTADGKIIDKKIFYFLPVKDLDLKKPDIKVRIIKSGSFTEIDLESGTLVKNLYMSNDNEGFFEDNYFDLVPGANKTVRFIPGIKNGGLKKLKFKSVYDTYNA